MFKNVDMRSASAACLLVLCTATDPLPPTTTASYDGTWWATFNSGNFDGPSGLQQYVTGQYTGRVYWDAEGKRARIDVMGTVNVTTSSDRGAPRTCNLTTVQTTTVLRDGSSYVVLPSGKCVRSTFAWSPTWPGMDNSALQLTGIDQCYPNGPCVVERPKLVFHAPGLPCKRRLVPSVEEGVCNSWGVQSSTATGYYSNDLLLVADGVDAGLPASWSYGTGGHGPSSGGQVAFIGGYLAIDTPHDNELASNDALFDVPPSCA
jgi:hypothetical protein